MNPLGPYLHNWLHRPWLFELGARIYSYFTQNGIWYESCAHLTEFFPAPRGNLLRVLELGCGPGVTAIQIVKTREDARVIGLDLAPRMLNEARGQIAHANLDLTQVPLVRADAQALPFANESFDVVSGHSFLYLVRNRERVLREAARVLRVGGRYVSMEPREGNVPSGVYLRMWRNFRYAMSVIPWRPYSGAHGRLTDARFRELFARAGLEARESQAVLEGLGIIGVAEKTGPPSVRGI